MVQEINRSDTSSESFGQSNALQIFDVHGKQWRWGRDLDGTAYVVASDVAKSFDHSNTSVMLKSLDGDEKGLRNVYTPGGLQEQWVVLEGGIWELIFVSRKPEARVIKKRVKQILRSLTSGQAVLVPRQRQEMPDITSAEGVLAMAEQFANTARQLVDADRKIRDMEPKALAHDALMTASDGDVLVRQAAKLLGWKEKTLRSFLVDEHLIYERQAPCGARQWDFYAANADHFSATEQVVEHMWGRCAHYTLHIRPAGLTLIQRRITKRKTETAALINAT